MLADPDRYIYEIFLFFYIHAEEEILWEGMMYKDLVRDQTFLALEVE